ncbi:MAG: glycosyltransferase family 4 protein [Patescibacteria group bacterium]
MRLLIVTQKVDKNDPILGFFHRWIIEFAKHFESIVVICLEKGAYELPSNVKVLSLGKENRKSRIQYILRFYKYIWQERKNYDVVFVHMNQEYLIMGGGIWRLIGKKVTMWRNHYAGSFLTDFASFFCNKIFCTSRFSYTARYKKTVLMPVGVDLENFKPKTEIARGKRSILFLARFSPSKRPDFLVEALKKITDQGIEYTASMYGDPIESDREYYQSIKEHVLKYALDVKFFNGVPNYKTPEIYSAHEIFVNLSASGMYDKTIFESIACGCLIVASNDNLVGQISDDFIFKQCDIDELTEKIKKLLDYSEENRKTAQVSLGRFVKKHSLSHLADSLSKNIN